MEDVNTNYGLSPMLCNLIANTIMPLPLPIDQVRSTYVPGPSDISAIQNSVECSEMALRSMEVQLPRIRKFYALQRSLLAPIRKLPDNVLGEIFIHVMGGYAIDIGARDGKIWALLQVCARWRKVVESTPALWNKFHVGKKEIRQETMSHRIEMCLDLSRTAPLSVSLYPHNNRVLQLQGIQCINQHANRFLCLSVSTDFLHWIQPIKPSQTPKVGPALRKLIVKGRSTYVDAFRWFPKATELEELRLDLQGRINLQSTIENKIRLTLIKRLTLKRCKIHGGKTVLSLLKTMRCLEELIWIDNKLKETFETGSRVELSRLHTLKISSGDRFDFWSYLQAHCLTDLHVRNCIAFDSLPSMFRMFARNRKNVHMDNCSNEFMINTINAIPDVEKLTLQMPAADSPTKVLRYLSRDKNPDKLPLLKELRIRIINGFSPLVKNVLVEEVLKSRSSGLDKSVEGSPSSDLDESFEGSPRPTALLSYVKLSMEVPQSYYEECTSPDTKLCMDEIKALASQSSMEIDFDIRVAEIGEYITEVEEERVMSEKIKIRNVSDDEDDGIWW